MSLSNSLLFCHLQSLGWAHSLCHPHGGFTGLDLYQRKFSEEKAAEFGIWPCLNYVLGIKYGASEDWHSGQSDLAFCYRLPNCLSWMMLQSKEDKWWPPLPPKTDITNLSQNTLSCWDRYTLKLYMRYTWSTTNWSVGIWDELVCHPYLGLFPISLFTVRSQASGILHVQLSP